MAEVSQFTFARYESDFSRGTIRFHYQLTHKGQAHAFVETLTFDPPSKDRIPKISKHLDRLLVSLHLLLGISYWKVLSPADIKVPYSLSEEQARFWDTLYTKGLGEFFYRNNIDFRNLVHFPVGKSKKKEVLAPIEFSNRSLVLLGAGKDSIVTAELLKKENRDFSLYALSPTAIHEEVASRVGRPLITIKRTLDPTLKEANAWVGAYNGHIPITSIFMLTGMLSALLYDFRFVIASNEESANYGNVTYLGSEMNHQWSKSFEFEKLLSEYVDEFIFPGISIFSMLRPLTEIHIAKLFSQYTTYFDAFTSCNTNFKIYGNPRRGQWCGKCPKCTFVFLLLAAFLPKETVVGIFQKNLFEDGELIDTYRELLGTEGFKPFECVGTPEETLTAFMEIIKKGEFVQDAVIVQLSRDVDALAKKHRDSATNVFTISDAHHIPKEFSDIIRAL